MHYIGKQEHHKNNYNTLAQESSSVEQIMMWDENPILSI